MENHAHDQDGVYARLVTVLGDKFEVPSARISPDATLGDLELDSLAVVELYVTLQEEWQVALDDSTASAELTIGDVARAVAGLLAEPGTDRGAA